MKKISSVDSSFLEEISRIIQGEHWDPHHILGLHSFQEKKVIRLWRPGAAEIYIEIFGQLVGAKKVHEAGFFEVGAPLETTILDYRVYHQNALLAHDPYSFYPLWGELDSHLFAKGTHYKLYETLGGRVTTHQGAEGVRFTVWAPGAMRVSLVSDFNFWDGRTNPMRSMGSSGVWELFVPGLKESARYKFEIKTQNGELRIKADPLAYASELRPLTASVIANIDRFQWTDQKWIGQRALQKLDAKPLNIYELHLGSWKMENGTFLNYRKIAIELADYCKEMGYTHIELLPIAEHPLDESWGYQVSGFYAVTSRFGTPEDFQFFVNHLHESGIGIFLDWVPGHFPTDDFSLARFDGSSLYEHADPRQGYHPHWNTFIFNYGRHEVSNFLIANALFWLEKMHIDGLRVDAVASIIYLDYGRESGMWIPNSYGTNENLEAIEFLKHLNSVVHQQFPGVTMIAEESSAFPGVTHPVDSNGLGFDFKWNMGWMNDTLRYFQKDPIYRSHHHNDLTFGLLYAFSEKFILVLSHDEVVHGKGSLLSKMPGDYWQKFANVRLLLTYMMTQVGKKLLFMSAEVGQWNEWGCKEEIHWHLLQYPIHKGLQTLVEEINHFYLKQPALWEKDCEYTGFEWVNFSDTQNSVVSYLRKGYSSQLLCVHHFTPSYFPSYFISLKGVKSIREVFNSDEEKYGGSGKKNIQAEIIENQGINISLAPLATHIFEIAFN